MPGILETVEVSKTLGTTRAVDRVSLTVHEGQILGLLGPNGAGKTTLIRMLTGIFPPDSGQVLFDGQPLNDAHLGSIGYLPEERGLYRKAQVLEQLEYLLRLRGFGHREARAAANEWLERMGLAAQAKSKMGELSKGMHQKVQIIACVAHRPRVVVLDEPLSGLDPVNAQLVEDLIAEFARSGAAVVFSTHRMEQAESFCPQIALINQGRVVLQGPVRDLKRSRRQNIFLFEADAGLDQVILNAEVQILEQTPARLRVKLGPGQPSHDLFVAVSAQAELLRMECEEPSLRDLFLQAVEAS